MENTPAQLVQVTGLAKRIAQRLLVICENKVELLVVEAEIRGADAGLADLERWISLNKVPLE